MIIIFVNKISKLPKMKKYVLLFSIIIATSAFQTQYPIPEEINNIIRIKDLIPEGNCNAVMVESRGLIYVGGQSQISIFAQQERLALIPYNKITGEKQNNFNDCVAMAPDLDGVWVGDKSGLGFINGKDFKPYPKIRDKKISAIAPIGNGQTLILSDSLLFLYNPFSRDTLAQITKNQRFIGLIRLSSNKIYACDKQGIHEIYHQQQKWELPIILKRNDCKSIFDTGDGKIGIATNNSIVLFEPNKKNEITYSKPKSSSITGVKCLGDLIFISTLDGLFKSTTPTVAFKPIDLQTTDKLPIRMILSLGLTHDNVLLIGTRAGGLLMYSPQRERLFQPFHLRMNPKLKPKLNYEVNDIHDFSLRSIIYDASTNTLYYGTDRGKVFKLTKNNDGKGFKNLGVLELDLEDPTLQIRSLALDGKGNIIVGTGIDFGSVFIHEIGKSWKSKKEIPIEGNSVKTISSLHVNKKESELLVGTNNGLYHTALSILESSTGMLTPLRNDTVKNIVDGLICERGQIYNGSIPMIKDKKGISGFDILHIAKDKVDTNTIWLFTRGAFVFQGDIKDGIIKIMRQYTQKNGLIGYDGAPASVVYGGFVDKFGDLWVSTNYGVYRKDKTSDQFDRFTPPVLGLPDNVDANTGAFCMINDSLIAFGFRHGGVLIHTEQYKKSNEGLIVVEKFKQDSFRLLDQSEVIPKNKPFDAINLIPFRMDWVYGGAEGIEAKFKNDSSVLMSGSIYAITPSMFDAWKVQICGEKIKGHIENQFEIKVSYHNYPVTIFGGIALAAFIFIGWRENRKRKLKKVEAEQRTKIAEAEQRAKIAEAEQRTKIAEAEQRTKIAEAEKAKSEAEQRAKIAEAKKAKSEAEKARRDAEKANSEVKKKELEIERLNAVHLLSSKALKEHFLKNTLDEIIKAPNFDKELKNLSFFSSLLNMPNINPFFIKEIKEVIIANKENNPGLIALLGEDIRNFYKTQESLSGTDNILIQYGDFFESIIADKELSEKAKEEVKGYYKFLVDPKESNTVMNDARFINEICLLYKRNKDYEFEFNNPDQLFTPGSGDIEIYSHNKDAFEKSEFPRMLVQPLVENAKNYGTKPFRMKVKYVHEIFEGKDWLKIEVINEGYWDDKNSSYVPLDKDLIKKKSLAIIEDIVLNNGGKWHGRKSICGLQNIPMIEVSFSIPIQIQKNA